jgi:hypothetical protein
MKQQNANDEIEDLCHLGLITHPLCHLLGPFLQHLANFTTEPLAIVS